MRKLMVSEFMTLDGVIQAPGGTDEDRDGGFEHGGWTVPYWHDDIGKSFDALMKDVDAILLGRRTYVIHAQAFEPMPKGDPFGDMMNAPRKYVVSRTLEKPIWRDTTIIRDNVDRVRAGIEGPARWEHCHGRQQSARPRAACARSGRRAAPARVSAVAGMWQASAAEWRPHDIRAHIRNTVPERCGGTPLCAPARVGF